MASAANPVTILLVDDDDFLRRFIRHVLTGEGFQVIEAGDGAEALKAASAYAGPIHLLLTDVIMPRINGLLLAERLLRDRPDTRVLYLSGYVESSMLLAKRPGSVLLQKPCTPDCLIAAVRHVLDLKSSSEERRSSPPMAPA